VSTTEKHTTIIEVDVSQALAADAKLRAATEAQTAAAKKLADVLEEGERERIASMRASHDAHVRAAAMRRMDARDAREEMAAARADALAARQEISGREAAERRAAAARAAAARDERADVLQRIALYNKEDALLRDIARTREDGFRRAEAAAERYTNTLRKQNAEEGRGGRGGGGVMGGMATGAAVGGAAGAAVVGGIAAVSAGIGLTDDLVNESYKAQAVSRNLQLDIRAARAELGGMVSDFDLATAANKAFAMGVSDTGADFAHFAGMVGEQATKLGRDQAELIGEMVEAVGKQESEIADNAGITMRLTDAYRLYAEQLNKSVDSLTAKEKAEAFNKATIIALEQATGRATVGVDGFAKAWKETAVQYKNFRAEFMGFDDMHGRAAEALRGLSDEQLERLKFADALNDEDAKRLDAMGRTAREMQGHIDEWGLSIMDLKEHADTMGVSYIEMLKQAQQAHALAAEAAEKERVEAEKMVEIQALNTEAEETEHLIDLLQIQGVKEKDILIQQRGALEVRREAAILQAEMTKSTGDQAKVLALTRQIELTEAKSAALKKGSGKGRDPNEALDRTTAATLRLLDARAKLFEAEHANERDLETAAAQRFYLIELAREELDVREAAADSRKVRGAAERDKLEAERLEIATEKRLLDIETETLARDESKRAGEERIAEMDREIERLESAGVAVQMLQMRRSDAHLAFVAEFGSAEEQRDAAHERALEIRQFERDEAAERAQGKLDAFTMETDIAAARGQQIYDITSRQLELEAQVAAAEGDHDRRRQLLHQRDVARIEERRAKVQRATQNANSMITQGAAVFDMVTGLTIKNEKKREKAALRARGVESIARAALETVESVAAFASLNIPQGILHAVAAGVGFTTGFAMIAGKEPGGGGGSAAGAASGGGADHQTVLGPDASSSAGAKGGGLPTTPPSAEELIRLRNGTGASSFAPSESKGGTVINISHSTVVSGDAGSLLSDLGTQDTRKWGSR
jgi:hypothetical protein